MRTYFYKYDQRLQGIHSALKREGLSFFQRANLGSVQLYNSSSIQHKGKPKTTRADLVSAQALTQLIGGLAWFIQNISLFLFLFSNDCRS